MQLGKSLCFSLVAKRRGGVDCDLRIIWCAIRLSSQARKNSKKVNVTSTRSKSLLVMTSSSHLVIYHMTERADADLYFKSRKYSARAT